MPEIIFTGSAGRIEGRYHPSRSRCADRDRANPHPQFGGTEPPDVYQLYLRSLIGIFPCCASISAASAARLFDHGQGEPADAASALDRAQPINPEARGCRIAGFSSGRGSECSRCGGRIEGLS
jgi:alpha/beta superfamily hydrolase